MWQDDADAYIGYAGVHLGVMRLDSKGTEVVDDYDAPLVHTVKPDCVVYEVMEHEGQLQRASVRREPAR